MRYVEETLEPDEHILYVAKYHWLYTFIAYAELILLGWLAGLGILLFFFRMRRKWTTHIAITNKRFIYDRGFLARRTIEVGRERVAGCKVAQNPMGRALDFGAVTVVVLAIGDIKLPALLRDPIGFRNVLTGQEPTDDPKLLESHTDTRLAA